MAFRTNKIPAIEERTVSGSSVSFNSAFALPLKACKVSFSATQAGSGDPSPSNPRAISGVSAIGLTANSTPVSVSLGDTRYGGYVDYIKKEAVITDMLINVSDFTTGWLTQTSGTKNRFYNSFPDTRNGSVIISNMFIQANVWQENTVTWGAYNNIIFTADFSYTLQDWLDFLSNNTVYIVCGMKTPITISLSDIPDLSSILGNNTFSTDTGTLEITFADLQEKSASGAVATFNTALAMPLVECKTEFMCTQASGTPSPSNPLAITGVDSVAIQKSGQNIMQESFEVGSISSETGLPTVADDRIRSVNYSPCLPNTRYYFVIPNKNLRILYYDDSYGYINFEGWYDSSRIIRTPQNCYYIKVIGSGAYGTTYNNDISINADSTDTAYHPYISNTVTLIDLDGTRYGGSLTLDNMPLTRNGKTLTGNENFVLEYEFTNTIIFKLANAMTVNNELNQICSHFVYNINAYRIDGIERPNTFVQGASRNLFIQISKSIANDLPSFKAWLQTEYSNGRGVTWVANFNRTISNIKIPTLSTIIGNNSFASDSGSIELKYKDLDIAKRGNFREVFKLPS